MMQSLRGWQCDIHTPESGTCSVASAGADGSASGIANAHVFLVKVRGTTGVIELAKAEKVVGEPWDDMYVAHCVVG